jgi:hypothetical protein
VGIVDITTLTNRQYCVILDPVGEDGKPQLGQKKLIKVHFFVIEDQEMCLTALNLSQFVCSRARNHFSYTLGRNLRTAFKIFTFWVKMKDSS